MFRHNFAALFTTIAFCSTLWSQESSPEKPHLDKILERKEFTPEEDSALDVAGGDDGSTPDGSVDVRDLVLYLAGTPISATFKTGETVVYLSEGSVTIPVTFSKPVSGEISFLLDESEPAFGQDSSVDKGYTLTGPSGPLENASGTNLTIEFGEELSEFGVKDISIVLNRQGLQGDVRPGGFSSHLVRVVSFDKGEFDGLLMFDSTYGFHPQKVRVGINSPGKNPSQLFFTSGGSPLGNSVEVAITTGLAGQPDFGQSIPISIDASALRGEDSRPMSGILNISKLEEPYPDMVAEFLSGYPGDSKPTAYQISLVIKDLFGAGTVSDGSFNIEVPGTLYLTRNITLPVKP